MPVDEGLAARIRDLLPGDVAITERRMFGGLAFMLDRHMAVAANHSGGVMLRVDPEDADGLVADTAATTVVMQGREMRGWLGLDADDVATDDQLEPWVARAVAFTRLLAPKD